MYALLLKGHVVLYLDMEVCGFSYVPVLYGTHYKASQIFSEGDHSKGEIFVNYLCLKNFDQHYRKSSIKPPGGLYYFRPQEGGLIREGGLIERGGLFQIINFQENSH